MPLLADAVAMPDWLSMLLGPLGALVGLIIAIKWLAGRLDKSEEKYDEREKERDDDRKTLILLVEQNGQVLKEVTKTLQGCPGRTKQ